MNQLDKKECCATDPDAGLTQTTASNIAHYTTSFSSPERLLTLYTVALLEQQLPWQVRRME